MSLVLQEDNVKSTETVNEFQQRHIGPNSAECAAMCRELDVESVRELIGEVVPSSIRIDGMPALPAHSEEETLAKLREYASQNVVARSLIGMGYSSCLTPTVILRNVLENPAWYTAYTPYQPEISQGRLEALLNFQTMVSDLTGLEIANASLLDEGTAAAEAMAFCHRVGKNKSNRFFVSEQVHPQTIAVIRTRASAMDIELVVGDHRTDLQSHECFAALFQYPATDGELYDYTESIEQLHQNKSLAILAADLLSLTLLKSPGEMGADVAVGSTQRFGVPLFNGGPHAAYFATHDAYKRSLPGRLIGVSKDRHGNAALRMALQTREQHIRRDKATSNVCTAQALLAMTAGFYGTYHGPNGLTAIAKRIQSLTSRLAEFLIQKGFTVVNQNWFDTLTVKVSEAATIHAKALEAGFNFRQIDTETIGISLDERTTSDEIARVAGCFAEGELAVEVTPAGIADQFNRKSTFMQHPVFRKYRSETEMLRYLRKLADKDLALDRTMIPLGSCTMKLNATTEMIPISWPEFCDIHPFAPASQTRGYQALIKDLESMLCDATGYDAVSLQPNAGSQGEFAGLLAIRAYQESRGQSHRNICLIPESAHGTNPASAKMAGLQIVVVKCDERGNVDLEDLVSKAETHSESLSCMMITYPSTHGVFEEDVRELCDIIHEHGGQVYIDGANLNAQVGLAEPGNYGGDVSHLNLHKTFCIPHGGGGPGVGPVAVGKHLERFLPATVDFNSMEGAVNENDIVISAAPVGSAGILPISWAYIYMMGSEGLKKASEIAILNANYIARRLADHYPILYTGKFGRIAHECIVDIRPINANCGVTVDDVAKRLIDFGFHAPTMSFPVAGTLMIEPTESESKAELDRFCDAMIQIREEIRKVENGEFASDDNPLANAPHTALEIADDAWEHSYSRMIAAYPVEELKTDKYWPPVARLDHAYGDRNVMCSCPPIESFADDANTDFS